VAVRKGLVSVSGGKIREPGKMKPLRQTDLPPRCDEWNTTASDWALKMTPGKNRANRI
jgi:hypothetical protein